MKAISINRTFNIIVFFLFCAAVLTGCKTDRAVFKAPLKEEGAEYLFAKMNENHFQFKTFSAKFNIRYTINKKPFEFKGQVKIVRDSAIWIMFNQDLSIEMARLLITQDSVKFLDRFNKQYFCGDYSFVNDFLKTNIDFGILQSIILGNDFEYYENAEFKASIEAGQYKLTTSGRNKLRKYVRNDSDAERVFLQSTWLNPVTFKITQIRMKELTENSKKLTAHYSDFEALEGQLFPYTISYEVEAAKPVKVDVRYSKVLLNNPMAMPFKIPDNYSAIH